MGLLEGTDTTVQNDGQQTTEVPQYLQRPGQATADISQIGPDATSQQAASMAAQDAANKWNTEQPYNQVPWDSAAQQVAAQGQANSQNTQQFLANSNAEHDNVLNTFANSLLEGTPYAEQKAKEDGELVQANDQATKQRANDLALDADVKIRQQELANRQKAADNKDQADETKVKSDLGLDKQDSNWGQMIAQGIAAMMGAYSQGLSGAKTNPVLDMMERQLQQKAKQNKWDQQQQMKAYEMMLKQADYQVRVMNANTNSALAKGRLAKMGADIEKMSLEVTSRKQINQLTSNGIMRDDEAMSIPRTGKGSEIHENFVPLGNGLTGVAHSKHIASKLNDPKEGLALGDKVLGDLDALQQKIDYFGDNPVTKIFSFASSAETKNIVQGIVGNMRLEYFGPGVLTDHEQNIAKSIIGDPSKIWSLEDSNKAVLHRMMTKYRYGRRVMLHRAGINLPPGKNDERIAALIKASPKLKKEDAINILVDRKKWLYNED
jgi:hypothetical protein